MSVKSRQRMARSQANTAAALYSGPQQLALSSLLRNTQAVYGQNVDQTKNYAASVRANALAQVNPLKSALASILAGQQASSATSAARLAAIGPGGADYAGAAAREAQAADARLAGQQAGAVTELNSRAADASSGAQYNLAALGRQYASDVNQIGQQAAGLASQRGLYASKAFNDAIQTLRGQDITLHGQGLTYKAAKARTATTIRGQNLSHADRQASIAARGSKGKGAKPLTPGQSNSLVSQIGQAKSYIDLLSGQGLDSHTIRQTLIQGHKTKSGNTIPAFKDPRIVNIAYDLHAFKALSGPNRVALLRQLRVRRASVPSSWLAPIRRPHLSNPLHLPGLP